MHQTHPNTAKAPLILAGCAAYRPGSPIPSAQLEEQLGLEQGWSEKNTGVAWRHWAAAEETVASMSANALRQALTEAEWLMEQIDLLLYAGGSFDHPIPYNACLIKAAMGAAEASFPCFDVDATCLSFVQALEVAQLYLQSGRARRIAIVSAELPSRALNPADPKTYLLFGDAAVAVLLSADSSDAGGRFWPGHSHFINQAAGAHLALVPAGGARQRETIQASDACFRMDGRRLISLTLTHLAPFIASWEQAIGHDLAHYAAILPHQTSRFGNEHFQKNYGLDSDRLLNTLADYGNCVAASIPLALYHWWVGPPPLAGQKLLFIGSAAGLSIGALEWVLEGGANRSGGNNFLGQSI